MKNLKRIIIFLSILIIVLAFIVIVIVLKGKKSNEDEVSQIDVEEEISNEVEITDDLQGTLLNDYDADNKRNIVQLVTDRNNYYAVEGFANTYIEQMKYNNIDTIINTLDKSYIRKYSITKDNIRNTIQNSYWGIEKYEVKLVINNMYYVETSDSISIYFIYGKTRNAKTNKTESFNLMIELDIQNNTYAILPNNYLKDKGYENVKVSHKFYSELQSIEKNNSNQFGNYSVSDEILIRDYLYRYRETAIYDKTEAYSMLDETYRNKRFGGLEQYNQYLKATISELAIAKIEKYNITNYDNYTQYDCIDKNGIHYIFRETAVMQYTVMLDNYTIETDEYKKEYADASDEEKVKLNISKFIKMINNKDYKQSYEVLNSTFKDKNYSTQDKFKSHIQSKLFDINKVSFENYEINNNNHICKVKIYDASDKTKEVYMNIIMKLEQGADFEMSFSFN